MQANPTNGRHPVAVLLGFSATGKSTLKREFEALEIERRIDIRDTDVMIGRDHGGHVFGVFLDLVVGNRRDKALRKIEDVERCFLKSFAPTRPTLIVAGPGVVIHEPEWKDFLGRVKPRGFYLMIDAAGVLDGLRHRFHEEVKHLGQHKAFGSWNEEVTTRFCSKTNRWERVDERTALEKIKATMEANIALYEAASLPQHRWVGGEALRENAGVRNKIIKEIRDYLLAPATSQ